MTRRNSAILAALAATCAPAAGAALDWIEALGGSFQEPKNWSFGFVPRGEDIARFGYREGAYNVTLSDVAIVYAVEAWRGDVAFVLQGQTLSALRDAPAEAPGAIIAGGADETAALAIRGLGRFNTVDLAVGTGAGSTGIFSVLDGARVTASGAATIGGHGVGALRIGAGARVVASSLVVAAGSSIEGAGVVVSPVFSDGAVSPGLTNAGLAARVGALTVSAPVTFSSAASLRIDIAPGAGQPPWINDSLSVAGLASLAGMVEVALLQGAAPSPGDRFVILSAAQIAGEFAGVMLSGADSLAFALEYTPTTVSLVVVPAPGALGVAGVALLLGARRDRRSRRMALW